MTDILETTAGSSAADVVDPLPADATPRVSDEPALDRLIGSFRMLLLQHARLQHHESTSRGLNNTDIRFVFFLSAAGQGVTPKSASEYLELSTGAMTSVIDRLEKAGHIERRPNPDDRRSVLIHLTESGTQIAVAIADIYRTAFRATIPADYVLPLALGFDQIAMALAAHSGVRS